MTREVIIRELGDLVSGVFKFLEVVECVLREVLGGD